MEFNFSKYKIRKTPAKKSVATYLPPDKAERIARYARKEGLKRTPFASELLIYGLSAYEKSKKK